jgi:hypothetical protein
MNACLHPSHLNLATSEETLLAENVSPFDVPKSLVASYILEKGLLSLNFKYIADESCRNLALSPEIRASIGRNSHRLYALSLPVRGVIDSNDIQSYASRAISRLPRALVASGIAASEDAPSDNYDIVSNLISSNSDQLQHFLESSCASTGSSIPFA